MTMHQRIKYIEKDEDYVENEYFYKVNAFFFIIW